MRDMERELQNNISECSNLAQQLYHLKGRDDGTAAGGDQRYAGARDEKDHMVELLKRNHDIVVEKYEIQRQRNESLEKTALEKERLYNEIKIENDQLANANYKLQRAHDDLANEKKILDGKFRNAEQSWRQAQDEARVLRMNNEKLDCQVKV